MSKLPFCYATCFACRAFEHSSIRAFEHSSIRAFEHSSIRAFEHSSIRAFEHSSIRAFEHSLGFFRSSKTCQAKRAKQNMPRLFNLVCIPSNSYCFARVSINKHLRIFVENGVIKLDFIKQIIL